jgi:hypothetical protein
LALFPVARELRGTGMADSRAENFLENSLIHGGGSDGSLPQARGEGRGVCPRGVCPEDMWDMGRCPEINTDATFAELLRREPEMSADAGEGANGAPEGGLWKWFKRSE